MSFRSSILYLPSSTLLLLGALLLAPEPVTAKLTKLRAGFADVPRTEINGWRNLIATLGKSEMARFLDMSLPDELQRDGFFERVGKSVRHAFPHANLLESAE